MPVATPGLVRLRRHQFARQSVFGTPVAANRAYPFSGVPDANLNWTDNEGDFGSLDLIAAPNRMAPDLTASLAAPTLYYNDIPLVVAAMFGGDVDPTGGGTAKTWTHQPASLTPDDLDVFTYEFGDDVDGTGGKPADWFQFGAGLLESLTINGPETMGPLTADMSWRFGQVRYDGATEAALQPNVSIPTALTVDTAGIPVYFGNAKLYIDSTHSDIGNTQIADALHSFSLSITQELDQKRFANGVGFDLSGYGRGARIIELSCQFAKTDDTVGVGSESDAWFSETAIERFVEIEIISTAIAEGSSPGTPYSWTVSMPMRYYTRTDGAVGGNSTVTLMGRAFYHPTLGYPFKSVAVNTLAAI